MTHVWRAPDVVACHKDNATTTSSGRRPLTAIYARDKRNSLSAAAAGRFTIIRPTDEI